MARDKNMAALNPLSDSDYSYEITALNCAKGATRDAHKKFLSAVRGPATSQTRDMLYHHACQLTDILSDLNGQRALVREAYAAPLPPRLEQV
jgi:hypothetical protein